MQRKIFAGVDIGSLTTKSVILSDGAVIGTSKIQTGIYPEKSGEEALKKAMKISECHAEFPDYTVATGYGRISSPYADETVTEITCHAKGAFFLHPEVRTVIDMGGQDCKVIRVDNSGNVTDFIMNDKCAAETGRFLEVIASVFKVDLDSLGSMAMQGKEIVPISSTCTVFAESEVISLLARGEKSENILRGIHHAIAQRITGMTIRVGIEDAILFSGGVANNTGMKTALEESFQKTIIVPSFDPQIIGALGAARVAESRYNS
ncbi:acyl-CoA dehydratase activase [Methanospirillum sp.]|uniref:acyl-CoA dehydratase activase n=1 Tax=Methanospirillum sp. TaxID=45200 RepID=UPI0035A0207E